eukprot:Nk52_evm15s219 gene=Nk52_evmTU15s219
MIAHFVLSSISFFLLLNNAVCLPTAESSIAVDASVGMLTPSATLKAMAAHGPMNNKYDAFMIYSLDNLNDVYRTYKAGRPIPPLKASFNQTKGVMPPAIAYEFNVELHFGLPQFSILQSGRIQISMPLETGSFVSQRQVTKTGAFPAVYTQLNGTSDGFTVTADLNKVTGKTLEAIVYVDVKASEAQILGHPDLQTIFGKKFEEHWRTLPGINFILGKFANAQTKYKALNPVEFSVCAVSTGTNFRVKDMIVVVINTEASVSSSITNNNEAFKDVNSSSGGHCPPDLLPASLVYNLIPQDSSFNATLIMSPRNYGSLLEQVMKNSFSDSSLSFDPVTGKLASGYGFPLADVYVINPNCQLGEGSIYSTNTGVLVTDMSATKEAIDRSAYGDSNSVVYSFRLGLNEMGCRIHWQGYNIFMVPSSIYCKDGTQVVAGFDTNLMIHFNVVSNTKVSITHSFDATSAGIISQCTEAKARDNYTFRIGMQKLFLHSAEPVPQYDSVLKDNLKSVTDVIDTFRISSLLFPSSHAMRFSKVAQTTDFVLMGSLYPTETGDSEHNQMDLFGVTL